MTDRDHFAAAALTGLLSDKANQYPTALQWEQLLKHAYRCADAMLRARERTDHDAAPAATAPTDASPLRSAQSVTAGMGTGNQTAPPCVEADGLSSAIAQPPASSDGSGEGRPLDDTRPDTKGEATGGRGRNTSVTNGDTSAKPVAESQDQRQEPVAWAVFCGDSRFCYDHYDDECEAQAIADMLAGDDRGDGLWHIVPLYREPQTCPYVVGRTTLHCSLTPLTLTDAEREAIRFAAVFYSQGGRAADAATLRNLLERTK